MDKDFLKLTSLQNPKIKQLVKLRDRRERDIMQRFLIEGYRELLRAFEANHSIESLFFCSEIFLGTNEWNLINNLEQRGAVIYACTPEVFSKISYRDRPDGLLAIAPQKKLDLNDLKTILQTKENPFLIVAEAIEKPGNLGTILRSSDAVGLDALILCDPCTDIYNPNVVRASVGTLFTVPVIEVSSKEALAWLKSEKIQNLASN